MLSRWIFSLLTLLSVQFGFSTVYQGGAIRPSADLLSISSEDSPYLPSYGDPVLQNLSLFFRSPLINLANVPLFGLARPGIYPGFPPGELNMWGFVDLISSQPQSNVTFQPFTIAGGSNGSLKGLGLSGNPCSNPESAYSVFYKTRASTKHLYQASVVETGLGLLVDNSARESGFQDRNKDYSIIYFGKLASNPFGSAPYSNSAVTIDGYEYASKGFDWSDAESGGSSAISKVMLEVPPIGTNLAVIATEINPAGPPTSTAPGVGEIPPYALYHFAYSLNDGGTWKVINFPRFRTSLYNNNASGERRQPEFLTASANDGNSMMVIYEIIDESAPTELRFYYNIFDFTTETFLVSTENDADRLEGPDGATFLTLTQDLTNLDGSGTSSVAASTRVLFAFKGNEVPKPGVSPVYKNNYTFVANGIKDDGGLSSIPIAAFYNGDTSSWSFKEIETTVFASQVPETPVLGTPNRVSPEARVLLDVTDTGMAMTATFRSTVPGAGSVQCKIYGYDTTNEWSTNSLSVIDWASGDVSVGEYPLAAAGAPRPAAPVVYNVAHYSDGTPGNWKAATFVNDPSTPSNTDAKMYLLTGAPSTASLSFAFPGGTPGIVLQNSGFIGTKVYPFNFISQCKKEYDADGNPYLSIIRSNGAPTIDDFYYYDIFDVIDESFTEGPLNAGGAAMNLGNFVPLDIDFELDPTNDNNIFSYICLSDIALAGQGLSTTGKIEYYQNRVNTLGPEISKPTLSNSNFGNAGTSDRFQWGTYLPTSDIQFTSTFQYGLYTSTPTPIATIPSATEEYSFLALTSDSAQLQIEVPATSPTITSGFSNLEGIQTVSPSVFRTDYNSSSGTPGGGDITWSDVPITAATVEIVFYYYEYEVYRVTDVPVGASYSFSRNYLSPGDIGDVDGELAGNLDYYIVEAYDAGSTLVGRSNIMGLGAPLNNFLELEFSSVNIDTVSETIFFLLKDASTVAPDGLRFYFYNVTTKKYEAIENIVPGQPFFQYSSLGLPDGDYVVVITGLNYNYFTPPNSGGEQTNRYNLGAFTKGASGFSFNIDQNTDYTISNVPAGTTSILLDIGEDGQVSLPFPTGNLSLHKPLGDMLNEIAQVVAIDENGFYLAYTSIGRLTVNPNHLTPSLNPYFEKNSYRLRWSPDPLTCPDGYRVSVSVGTQTSLRAPNVLEYGPNETEADLTSLLEDKGTSSVIIGIQGINNSLNPAAQLTQPLAAAFVLYFPSSVIDDVGSFQLTWPYPPGGAPFFFYPDVASTLQLFDADGTNKRFEEIEAVEPFDYGRNLLPSSAFFNGNPIGEYAAKIDISLKYTDPNITAPIIVEPTVFTDLYQGITVPDNGNSLNIVSYNIDTGAQTILVNETTGPSDGYRFYFLNNVTQRFYGFDEAGPSPVTFDYSTLAIPAGSYSVYITGVDTSALPVQTEALILSTSLSLGSIQPPSLLFNQGMDDANPLPFPVPLFPAPIVSWDPIPGALGYRVSIDADGAGTNLMQLVAIQEETFFDIGQIRRLLTEAGPATLLSPTDDFYYLRVQSVGQSNISDYANLEIRPGAYIYIGDDFVDQPNVLSIEDAPAYAQINAILPSGVTSYRWTFWQNYSTSPSGGGPSNFILQTTDPAPLDLSALLNFQNGSSFTGFVVVSDASSAYAVSNALRFRVGSTDAFRIINNADEGFIQCIKGDPSLGYLVVDVFASSNPTVPIFKRKVENSSIYEYKLDLLPTATYTDNYNFKVSTFNNQEELLNEGTIETISLGEDSGQSLSLGSFVDTGTAIEFDSLAGVLAVDQTYMFFTQAGTSTYYRVNIEWVTGSTYKADYSVLNLPNGTYDSSNTFVLTNWNTNNFFPSTPFPLPLTVTISGREAAPTGLAASSGSFTWSGGSSTYNVYVSDLSTVADPSNENLVLLSAAQASTKFDYTQVRRQIFESNLLDPHLDTYYLYVAGLDGSGVPGILSQTAITPGASIFVNSNIRETNLVSQGSPSTSAGFLHVIGPRSADPSLDYTWSFSGSTTPSTITGAGAVPPLDLSAVVFPKPPALETITLDVSGFETSNTITVYIAPFNNPINLVGNFADPQIDWLALYSAAPKAEIVFLEPGASLRSKPLYRYDLPTITSTGTYLFEPDVLPYSAASLSFDLVMNAWVRYYINHLQPSMVAANRQPPDAGVGISVSPTLSGPDITWDNDPLPSFFPIDRYNVYIVGTSADTGELYYYVHRETAGTGPYSFNYAALNLPNGNYDVYVTASNATQQSQANTTSNPISITKAPVPPNSATDDNVNAKITWDFSGDATEGYNVYVSRFSNIADSSSPYLQLLGENLITREFSYRDVRKQLLDIRFASNPGDELVSEADPDYFFYVASVRFGQVGGVRQVGTSGTTPATGTEVVNVPFYLMSVHDKDNIGFSSIEGRPVPGYINAIMPIEYNGPISTTYSWTLTGGTPSSSTDSVPFDFSTITYNDPGTNFISMQPAGYPASNPLYVRTVVDTTQIEAPTGLNVACNPLPTPPVDPSVLTWDPVSNPRVVSYNVYISESSGITDPLDANLFLLSLGVDQTGTSFDFTTLRYQLDKLFGAPGTLTTADGHYLYVGSTQDGYSSGPLAEYGSILNAGIYAYFGTDKSNTVVYGQAGQPLPAVESTLGTIAPTSIANYTINTPGSNSPNTHTGIGDPSGVILGGTVSPPGQLGLTYNLPGEYTITIDCDDGGVITYCISNPLIAKISEAGEPGPADLTDACTLGLPSVGWNPPPTATPVLGYNIYVSETSGISNYMNADLVDVTPALPSPYTNLTFDYSSVRKAIKDAANPNVSETAEVYYIYVSATYAAGQGSLSEVQISPGPYLYLDTDETLTNVSVLQGNTITSTINSIGPAGITTYSWTFEGGVPLTSTDPLPFDLSTIAYNLAGDFNAYVDTTTASNQLCRSNFISVEVLPAVSPLDAPPVETCGQGGVNPVITWAEPIAGGVTEYIIYVSSAPIKNELTTLNAVEIANGITALNYNYENLRADLALTTIDPLEDTYILYVQTSNGVSTAPVFDTGSGWSNVGVEVRPGPALTNNVGSTQLEWPLIPSAVGYDVTWSGASSGSAPPPPVVIGGSSATWNYSTLSPTGAYTVEVTWTDGVTESCSSVINIDSSGSLPQPIPSAPTDNCGTGGTDPTISWNTAVGATEYNVFIATSLDPSLDLTTPAQQVGTAITGTTFSYDNIRNSLTTVSATASTYYLYVQSDDGASAVAPVLGSAGWTNVALEIKPGPGLVDNSGSTQIEWEAIPTATGTYSVSWSGAGSGSDTVAAPGTGTITWDYSGLADGSYTVEVKWTDGIESCASTLNFTKGASVDPIPAPPTDGCTPGGNTPEITWSTALGATEYNVFVSASPVIDTLTAGVSDQVGTGITGTTFSYDNIRNSLTTVSATESTYYLYVQSSDGVSAVAPVLGSAGWTNVALEIKPGPGLVDNSGSTQIEWEAIPAATGNYSISYSGAGSGSDTVAAPGTGTITWGYSGLADGSYTVEVKWTDGIESCASTLNFTKGAVVDPIPAPPTDGCTPGGNTPEITWSTALGASEYNVFVSASPVVDTLTAGVSDQVGTGITGTTFSYNNIRTLLSTVTPATDPTYQLYVQSSDGVSAVAPVLSSAGWTGVARTIRPGPGITDTGTSLTWPAIPTATGNYSISYSGAGSGSDTVAAPGSGTITWNYSGLAAGAYTVEVTWTEGSTVSCATTIAITVTSTPPGLVTNLNDDCPGAATSTISWDAGAGATQYNVFVSSSPAISVLTTGNSDQVGTAISALEFDYNNIRTLLSTVTPATDPTYQLYVQSSDALLNKAPVLGAADWTAVAQTIRPGPGITDTGTSLTWPAIPTATGNYSISYSGSGTGSDTVAAPGTGTITWPYSSLGGGSYTVEVTWTEGSTESCATTMNIVIGILLPPVNETANTTALTVTWEGLLGQIVEGYYVYVTDSSGNTTVYPVTGESFDYSMLPSGTYSIVISSYFGTTESATTTPPVVINYVNPNSGTNKGYIGIVKTS